MNKAQEIVDLFLNHPEYPQHKIARKTGVNRKTVSYTINKYKVNLSIERRPGSGRTSRSHDKDLELAIMKFVQQEPECPNTELSRKFKVSRTTILKMKKRNGFTYCAKQNKLIMPTDFLANRDIAERGNKDCNVIEEKHETRDDDICSQQNNAQCADETLNISATDELENHQDKCRLCLKSFDENEIPITAGIMKKIQDLNIEIIQSVRYSNFICYSCESYLEDFSSFRNGIMEQQKKLTLYLCRIKEDFQSSLHNEAYGDPIKIEYEMKPEIVIVKTEPDDDYLHLYDEAWEETEFNMKSEDVDSTQSATAMQALENKRTTRNRSCKNKLKVLKKPEKKPLKTLRLNHNLKFECDYCGKRFSDKYMLNVHLLIHTSSSSQESKQHCDICLEYFSSRISIKDHNNAKHGPFTCYCGETFVYKYALTYHDKYVHNRELHERKCDQCGQVFMDTTKLKAHIRIVHKVQHSCICEHCGKAFTSHARLMSHECPNGEKKHLCDAPGCKSAFSLRRDLTDHKKAFHFKRKEYSCPHPGCDKIFFKKPWVKTHVALVHENIPQNCPIDGCSHQASISQNMGNHLKRHKELSSEDMQHYKEVVTNMYKKQP